MVGHDECIFRQCALTNKSWNGPQGQKTITPKDLGQGIMISTFQSRAFGFGMVLSEQQLEEINFFVRARNMQMKVLQLQNEAVHKKSLPKALCIRV